MQNVDLLITGKWLLSQTTDSKCLRNQAIAIDDGKIIDILPAEHAKTRFDAKQIIEKKDHVLMPGLINTHNHTPMTLLRGLADDLQLLDWLENHIWPAEQKWVDYDFAYWGSQLAIAEMIKSGTTCFHDMYFFPEATCKAATEAGMRARIGINVMDLPTAWGSNAKEYLAKGLALYEAEQSNPLLTFSLAPHSVYTVQEDTFREVKNVADNTGLPIHIHAQESASEIAQSIEQHKARPLQHLAKFHLITKQTMLVHMTQVNAEDIDLLQTSGAHIIHCPESNMKLASGYCPVNDLLKAGINVALGTDGAASNNNLNMFSEMRTAALLGKLMTQDASAIPATTALKMATINGARALQMEREIGSLEVGKLADIIAVDMRGLATQPAYHPHSHLVYSSSREQVTDVWVGGKQVMDNRKLTTIDEEALLANVGVWQGKIAGSN